MSQADFKDKTKFTGWDFDNAWSMGDDYPVLRSSLKLSSKKTTLNITDTQSESYNLTNYLDIILSDDYEQDGRFTYDFESGNTVKRSVLNNETLQTEEKNVEFATINGDILSIEGNIGIGTYPLKITATDKKNEYEPITISLDVVVNHRVPEPKVLINDISYSRSQTLRDIPVTYGWDWVDKTICPKNTNTTGYPVFYKYDDDLADERDTYYDISTVEDKFEVTYDEEKKGIWVCDV